MQHCLQDVCHTKCIQNYTFCRRHSLPYMFLCSFLRFSKSYQRFKLDHWLPIFPSEMLRSVTICQHLCRNDHITIHLLSPVHIIPLEMILFVIKEIRRRPQCDSIFIHVLSWMSDSKLLYSVCSFNFHTSQLEKKHLNAAVYGRYVVSFLDCFTLIRILNFLLAYPTHSLTATLHYVALSACGFSWIRKYCSHQRIKHTNKYPQEQK